MPGTLTLRPLSAKLTRDTELFGTMDPYCKVVLGKQKVQSEVCENGGKYPHWEGSSLVLKRNTEPFVEMEIKEKDWLLPDGTIGTCKINLVEVEKEKRVLKWYPVLFKDKPAGKILVEASYQPEGEVIKNAPISGPQQVQPMPVQPMPVQHQIPQVAPISHDFRQPIHNQAPFQEGYIHGYNPMNQAPPQNAQQAAYNQPTYNHPPVSYNPVMYAPPTTDFVEQEVDHNQKYPTFESQNAYHGHENQGYGHQQNVEPYSENQNGYPYNYESRPVTDFPHPSGFDKPESRGVNGIDIIRGTR